MPVKNENETNVRKFINAMKEVERLQEELAALSASLEMARRKRGEAEKDLHSEVDRNNPIKAFHDSGYIIIVKDENSRRFVEVISASKPSKPEA
jgi:predicted  nucleic acid-binding Zn-ribbon protein